MEKLYAKILIIFLGVLLIANVLAIDGKLSVSAVRVLLFLLCFIAMASTVWDIVKKRLKISKFEILALGLLLFVSIFTAFHPHDLPIGRDDSAYMIFAHQIVETGSLSWEDFFSRPIHGVRQIDGDIFTSQFLPLYSVYLSLWDHVFGIAGQLSANALLIFLTGFVLFFIGRMFHERTAILVLLFWLSSYLVFWFSRRLNSENLFMLIFWTSVWFFMKGCRERSFRDLLAGLFVSSLLVFTRGEGVPLFALYAGAMIFLLVRLTKKKVIHVGYRFLWLILPTLSVFFFFDQYLSRYGGSYLESQFLDIARSIGEFLNVPLFVGVAAVCFFAIFLLKKKWSWFNQQSTFYILLLLIGIIEGWVILGSKIGLVGWGIYRVHFVFSMFAFYLIFPYALLILWGLKKKIYTAFDTIPIFLALPLFIFFVEPNIALDQPWFMRRFYPVIFPILLLFASIALTRIELHKKTLFQVTLGLLAVGLFFAFPVMQFKENNGLRNQLEKIRLEYPSDTLLLFDPGWAWQKLAIPLHYFFGVNVLPNLDLYPPRELREEVKKLTRQYPNWNDPHDFTDLLAIKNEVARLNRDRFLKHLRDKQYREVIVWSLDETFPHDLYSVSNLEPLDQRKIVYPQLKKSAALTGYIQSRPFPLDIPKIRKELKNIPPTITTETSYDFFTFRVLDPYRIEEIREVETNLEGKYEPGTQTLAPDRLDALRKDITVLLRNV